MVIDPRITFIESSYIFKQVDKNEDGSISMEEFKKIFVDYDFIDINDKASRIITDLKEIVKANKIDLKEIFRKSDTD